jgi:hypothetical protein
LSNFLSTVSEDLWFDRFNQIISNKYNNGRFMKNLFAIPEVKSIFEKKLISSMLNTTTTITKPKVKI